MPEYLVWHNFFKALRVLMNDELKVVHYAFKDKAFKAHSNKFKEGKAYN